MCPACITTAALVAAGTTSGAGVVAIAVRKWRTVLGWFSRCIHTAFESVRRES